MYFAAQAYSRKLRENLALTVQGDSTVESLDANGYPMVVMTVNSDNFFYKIEPIEASGMVDGLGLPQRAYSPHMITLILDPTSTQKAGHYDLIAKGTAMGMRINVMEGAVKALTDYPTAFAAATLITTVRSNEIHPLTLSV